MASLIPGYEYDIFISYRQKDNKGDRWVSEFVEALKTELESTFKEEINVYFDINPHDGLLETHDVDASLKEKLKCLIFIPIISRTYCDPKSFAWEHEFKVFVELASKDQFGLKIKLPNGNVANRVLPIRIHDLDTEDLKLFESVLGGVLRGIEFIYKEPGVNRPLRSEEDNPSNNLNKTFYRNQINKVAIAIKEIIVGLKEGPNSIVKEKTQLRESSEEVHKEQVKGQQEKSIKSVVSKLFPVILISPILVIAAILAYPKIFKRNTLEKLRSSGERISIAVMPFLNRTGDATWDDWQNGIQDILITYFSNSDELLVRQTESTNSLINAKNLSNYAALTPTVASNLSKKLEAQIFIYGSINQAGNRVRLIAKLIDSKTREILKPFQIEGPASEEYIFNIVDSFAVEINNFLVVTQMKEKEQPYLYKHVSANSPEAYRKYISGMKTLGKKDWRTASEYFKEAVKIDTNFIIAKVMLSWAFSAMGLYEESRKLFLDVYEERDQLPKNVRWFFDYAHAFYTASSAEELKKFLTKQLSDNDNQDPMLVHEIGVLYRTLGQHSDAISEYEKALEIYENWKVKPFWAFTYTDLGDSYVKTGQYKKAKKLYKKAEKDFPDDLLLINRQATLSLILGDTITTNFYIKKYMTILKENGASELEILMRLATIYSNAGMIDKEEQYYRKILLFEPENPTLLNNLAYSIFKNNINLDEGLNLIDKALQLNPDNYIFIATKGELLLKLGKYKEALELLEKSWKLKPEYNHEIYLDIQEAKKAVASQKNN